MLRNKFKPGYFLLLLMILAGFGLESWKINQQPVEEWDEARRGINALGMLSTGDYLNYLEGSYIYFGKPLPAENLTLIGRLDGYRLLYSE